MNRFQWFLVLLIGFVTRPAAAEYMRGRTGGASDAAATQRTEQLRRAVDEYRKRRAEREKQRTKATTQESVTTVKEAYKKGEEAYREQRYAAAFLHFSSVASCKSSKGTADTIAKARAKALEIEAMAEEKLELAKVLMKRHQPAEAADALLEVVENFGYCPSAGQARTLLIRLRSTPSVAASLRHAEGKAQEDAENYLDALRIYDEVAKRWPDELAAWRARVAAKKLRRDPEKMAFARESLEAEAERKCPTLITMAKSFLMNLEALKASKTPDAEAMAEIKLQAVEKLQIVIREYPATPYAKRASEALKVLSKGKTAQAMSLLDKEPEEKED